MQHFVVLSVTMEVYLLLLVETARKFSIGGGKSLFDNDAKVFSVSNIDGQLIPSV